ncbi:MAG TPA: hypothetical protein VMF58_10315 [Rhizomicrobium sp.]|nr:hypothetical protein [Rhizomicrobium sp.]
MAEIKTLRFPNTARGQADKVRALQRETSLGWRVVSETIVPGKFRGGEACCLFLICMPCAFLAGHNDDIINVTLQRDSVDQASAPPSYDSAKWAALLKYDTDIAAAADLVRPLGSKWEDELAVAYLTLNEKRYLSDIVARISDGARLEREEKEKAQAQEAELRLASEQEALLRQQARLQRRQQYMQMFWGSPLRSAATLCGIAFFLLMSLLLLVYLSHSPDPLSPDSAVTPNRSVDGSLTTGAGVRPSFDCGRVQSVVLKLICSTPSLARSDDNMSEAYRAAYAVSAHPLLLRRGQRGWLIRRNNASANVPLLMHMYEQRTSYLKSLSR